MLWFEFVAEDLGAYSGVLGLRAVCLEHLLLSAVAELCGDPMHVVAHGATAEVPGETLECALPSTTGSIASD